MQKVHEVNYLKIAWPNPEVAPLSHIYSVSKQYNIFWVSLLLDTTEMYLKFISYNY